MEGAEDLLDNVELDVLLDFVSGLLRVTLGAAESDLLDLRTAANAAKLSRFAADTASAVIFVQKYEVSSVSGRTTDYNFVFAHDLDSSALVKASLAILKGSTSLSAELPLQEQVQVINLPGSDRNDQGSMAYEALHDLIHFAISPYFNAFSKDNEFADSSGRKAGDPKKGVPAARKKLAELELSLLHLQQNVEIPNIQLVAHPLIQQAIKNASAEGSRPSISFLPDARVIEDMVAMNAIQATTVVWRQQIKQVTEKDRDPLVGTANQEINFWLNLDQVLADVERQLRGEAIALTFEVLAAGKRLGVNSAMIMQDTGFRDARDKVKSYSMLMRDFPLNELLSAPSLEKAADAVDQIFEHINRRLRAVPYPVARAIPLAEAITKDIETQIYALLRGRKLMHLNFQMFSELVHETHKVFSSYDNKIRDFVTTARDVLRKRSEKFLVVKVSAAHTSLQERLAYLRQFRHGHEQLSSTIVSILGTDPRFLVANTAMVDKSGDLNAVQEIHAAYNMIRDIDVLDVTPEGTETWVNAEQEYDDRIARVESTIIGILRSRLDAATSANEMFRVFSTFNALFVRPKIRGAVQEYQNQLIEGVKSDLSRLQDKFRHNYSNSDAFLMNTLRDIPPVSGHIIWARQINRQLDSYMEKVETVLGDGWHLYAEGQKLHLESSSFRKKLDTRPIFDSWFKETNANENAIKGAIFLVQRKRANGNKLELTINFDKKAIDLFKEVRNLHHLGFSIPHLINTAAKTAKQVYPHAMRIIDSNTVMQSTYDRSDSLGGMVMLTANFHNEVQVKLKDVSLLTWDYFKEESSRSRRSAQVVAEWSNAVSILQSKVDILSDANHKIESAISSCESCSYSSETFRTHLESLQTVVDQLILEGYTNLGTWVESLNRRLERIFTERARSAAQVWSIRFQAGAGFPSDRQGSVEDSSSPNFPDFDDLKHEIVLKNQVIVLEPPLEFARARWHSQLSSWLRIVSHLPRLRFDHYEMGAQRGDRTFSDTFAKIAYSIAVPELLDAHSAIRTAIDAVNTYVTTWLQFQALWDLRPQQLWDLLGEDLAKWLQMLTEIRKTRFTFDTSDSIKRFGSLIINYEQVQARVNAKYDSWQKDVLVKFAQHLGNHMHETYAAINKSRRDLETQTLDSSTTASAVVFITSVQDCRRSMPSWEAELKQFKLGQATLQRQRFQLDPDWLYVERVEDEWAALIEIYNRKDKLVSDQLNALCAKITAEDQTLHSRIMNSLADWNQQKPLAGDIAPEAAMTTLRMFDQRFAHHRNELGLIKLAQEALELPTNSETNLEVIVEEVQDLMSVWSAVHTIWAQLNDLKELLWSSVVPRKLRSTLEALNTTTKEMPGRMRQYAAFEFIQNVLRQYIKVNSFVLELKSDAIRERHWNKLFKTLLPQERLYLPSMTLGTIWNLNLLNHAAVLKQVILEAQGELALEQFLREVKDRWNEYILDLVSYNNKCKLIRGWDDLFVKSSDDLHALVAIKHSPHFKTFEDEALLWEDKLTRLHLLFDVWIDVQRQWVYLEGILTGNTDIQHLLPNEYSRFANINTEFFSLMRKVSLAPLVLDVIAIAGVQKTVERLAEMLQKIQKALGEYLEKERANFPRFYFVGDEDLLEIIGNSGNVLRIQKHLNKMFAGIASLQMSTDGRSITGFCSKEYETVLLSEEISLDKVPKVNEWLAILELQMRTTLAGLLHKALQQLHILLDTDLHNSGPLVELLQSFPVQVLVLAFQCASTSDVEQALSHDASRLSGLESRLNSVLGFLATIVLGDIDALLRSKCESLLTACVHHRDVLTTLIKGNVNDTQDFHWLYHMRFYHSFSQDVSEVTVKMASTSFAYGFEYLGVPDRLVQTPLTDRCYLSLTQALSLRLGGSPFGPAGTGKTETVKALGIQLGRFVLVFCCDDTFDFQSMGRIFLGLCQVGAWGCFDEFNRLEERILSAVSQQIQTIQLGLRESLSGRDNQIELIGKRFTLHQETGVFITMNPGYAGRSNLPDNLKRLFRSIAMTKPDKELIAEVTFYAQGFQHAQKLASQVVPFFDACEQHLSPQVHYDFGLRALKSVLLSCGNLKRANIRDITDKGPAELLWESSLIVRSVRETIMPKLVGKDPDTMISLLDHIFPDVLYTPTKFDHLRSLITEVARTQGFNVTDLCMEKILQLHQIILIHHGVMMVGDAGVGKSVSRNLLSAALQRESGVESITYTIDAKVMSKEALYGKLEPTTREWTDGLLTGIIRRIVDNLRNENAKRHWIVFDGDVDPDWVENMNSMLDDNKILTLPNGERLNLPSNVRIIFEVDSLKYATLATVSRCGMVFFDHAHTSSTQLLARYLHKLRISAPVTADDGILPASRLETSLHCIVADVLAQYFEDEAFMMQCYALSEGMEHVMHNTESRAMSTLLALMTDVCRTLIHHNTQNTMLPLSTEQIENYTRKKLLLSIIWSYAGDCVLEERQEYGGKIHQLMNVEHPVSFGSASILDFDVNLPEAQWTLWKDKVPTTDVEPNRVTSTDLVIPTTDTMRQEAVLYSLLSEHRPLILCGPPGSGKTMTLLSALRKLPHLETVGLNFSSATTVDLVTRTLEQYCEYRKTLSGTTLCPPQLGKWLVLFCDEINLPSPDSYGTQRVNAFLRQLVESSGFWRSSDRTWVTLERVQFVGACNPPSDVGRSALSARFLRHTPIIMVGYPDKGSLYQIYSVLIRATLKYIPILRGYFDALTNAMIDMYTRSRERFTVKQQPHYIYSPREMTRWVRGIAEAIKPLDTLSVEGLVRIWAHEACRLFEDRLVLVNERAWTRETIRKVALMHFPTVDEAQALDGPLLYSDWLSQHYSPVSLEDMRQYIRARLKTFCEEEVDTPIVPYDEVIEHVLKIDRVFKQPQGHLILIGISGSGKTTLSRFVAWINGLKTFQIKIHSKYSASDFDDDLRNVLRRCGTRGEKICFILDESNVLESGFLERMNTLLANAEIPGLFEGDELAALMTSCKEGSQRDGLVLDNQEELYQWYTQQIVRNLHVVFTMNPANDLATKATTSPALFNRCVLNWFGDWSASSCFQVAQELTRSLDLECLDFVVPQDQTSRLTTYRDVVSDVFVEVHRLVTDFNYSLESHGKASTHVTPRNFLDMIRQFLTLYEEKRGQLEDQQRHLNAGLEKLHGTVDQVNELRTNLANKKQQLKSKNIEANEKLQNMVTDQQEAEHKKIASLEIQEALSLQEEEISKRRTVVLHDLALAEPAVIEAQKSVSNIKKQQLTEVRSMANPPEAVKLAMESVCTLLGHQVEGWKAVQSVIRRDDFISSIVHFDSETQMTPSLRAIMQKEYLSKATYQYEAVNRASKACGPLVQWVHAQVSYSEILEKVGPLRTEVENLQKDAILTRRKADTIFEMIQELEDSISRYKLEYAELISQTQAIKAEMTLVESRVSRSVRLLDSLQSERQRWHETSQGFAGQMQTLTGDVILSAAFLAYSGFFDQMSRQVISQQVRQALSNSSIEHSEGIMEVNLLASVDDKVNWSSNGLPTDDLCVENAVILGRFVRYPLIIDPSDRAATFLECENKQRALIKTSFLDDSYRKHLETAVRFGSPILISDAEYFDPILNKILNREYQKTGGRTLVELGRQEIDISPTFRLYLSTRNPLADFSPDICSRVTIVNFTITKSSLETQSLNAVLRSERPDIEARRDTAIKAQGEFRIRLRRLEKDLLEALSNSRGNILEDDHVIETLETLKSEAAEISRRVGESDGVMQELEAVTTLFATVGSASSKIFTTLETLTTLNHFYRFSLIYFEEIFNEVLQRAKVEVKHGDQSLRIQWIVKNLYSSTLRRTKHALLHQDKLSFALLLVVAMTTDSAEIEALESILRIPSPSVHLGVGKLSHADVEDWAAKNSSFPLVAQTCQLMKHAQSADWQKFLLDEFPDQVASRMLHDHNGHASHVSALFLIKCFRPDKLLACLENYVSRSFSAESLLEDESKLQMVTMNENAASTPIMLCSVPGIDAAHRVDNLVEQNSVRCVSIAMGSSEGISNAEKAITRAAQSGTWVLLKNVHLAISWLGHLEKRLSMLQPNKNFRLFLTLEISPKVPVNIIRMSRTLMFEAPPGLRANIGESLSSIPQSLARKEPVERARVYFLLAWLHAVIQERLRYPGIGWSKAYEFNTSDFESAREVANSWLDNAASGRSNIAPGKIPWRAIRTLLAQSVYGGKIDHPADQSQLDGLVERLLTPEAFEINYLLVDTDEQKLRVPEAINLQQFQSWTEALPEREPPTWLGLRSNTQQVMLENESRRILATVSALTAAISASSELAS